MRGFYRLFFSFECGMNGSNRLVVLRKAGRTPQGGGTYEL